MKISTTLRLLCLAALCAFPLSYLRAHAVWIEATPEKQLVIRFGEPGELYEKSPGLLDKLGQPAVWTAAADGQSAVATTEKKADHFLCVGADPAAATCGETAFAVFARKNGPATRPVFYLRWLPASASQPAAALTLDIVPTRKPGEFAVLFRKQPLTSTSVTVHAPGEKETTLKTDEQGVVAFAATKPGLHLLTVNHQESVTGFALGQTYERVSHNASVAWHQP